MKKKALLLPLIACMATGAVQAQDKETGIEARNAGNSRYENHWYNKQFADNLFIGASGGYGFRLSKYDFKHSEKGFGGQASYRASFNIGKWTSPYIGWQLHAMTGEVPDKNRKFTLFSAEALWDVTQMAGGYREDRRFSFIPLAGVGVGITSNNGGKPIFLSFGFQGRWRLGAHVDFITEVRGNLMNDGAFMLPGSKNSPIGTLFAAQAGLNYVFGKRAFSRFSYSNAANSINAMRIEELNGEVNALRKQVADLREELKAKNDSTAAQPAQSLLNNQITSAIRQGMYIEIRFPEYSFYLSEAEKKNIAKVANWIKETPHFNICVTAFSDELNDKDFDRTLKKNRTNSILKELIDVYKVNPDRIRTIDAEAEGLAHVTDCSAIITFMPINEQK